MKKILKQGQIAELILDTLKRNVLIAIVRGKLPKNANEKTIKEFILNETNKLLNLSSYEKSSNSLRI